MEDLCKILINAFRYVLPEEVINGEMHWNALSLEKLVKICSAYDYRIDEMECRKRLQALKGKVDFQYGGNLPGAIGMSDLIECFNEEVLMRDHEEVVCRFEKLHIWRKVSNKVDGDIFTAAKYAEVDYQNGQTRNSFIWPSILGHNNVRINKILAKGISENHFHLHNAVHYFSLSWLVLMNDVKNTQILTAMENVDNDRKNKRINLELQYGEKKYAVLHLQAAFIRIYLFAYLTNQKIKLGSYNASWNWVIEIILKHESLEEFSEKCELYLVNDKANSQKSEEAKNLYFKLKREFPRLYWLCVEQIPKVYGLHFENEFLRKGYSKIYIRLEEYINRLIYEKRKVDFEECRWIIKEDDIALYDEEWNKQTLENLYGILQDDTRILHSYGELDQIVRSFQICTKPRSKDYATGMVGDWKKEEENEALIAGERWLLYTMFRRKKDKDSRLSEAHYDLFLVYLLIKESFRMELLQSNDRRGFYNFKTYQNRKAWFTVRYRPGDFARSAIDSTVMNQNILSLEIRTKPGDTYKENVEMIRCYDHAIKEGRMKEEKFFYVFHFSKKPDDTLAIPKAYSRMFYRHYALRKKVCKQMEALLEFREKCPEYARRVLGIDACSDEDGCRPEVFAPVFRVLKHHSCFRSIDPDQEIPQIRMTYHVGEVFQDIADGLRAIDEAVHFMNMECGDRLGHATVLGIDVEKWYREQNYVISIRRQDYLDNIVWLYEKLIQYRVKGMGRVIEYLTGEFELHFSLIYGKVLESDYIDSIIREACDYDKEYGEIEKYESMKISFGIHTYYYSWMLRGDHPELYANGYYKRKKQIGSLWDKYEVNFKYPEENKIRYILPASILNHYYHYILAVKELGNISMVKKIPVDIVKALTLVQREMQRDISKKGIAIETNPSSNIMLSKLESYEEHPIVNFYNKGLTDDYEQLSHCEQLNVSINSDNPGVFATSLSNEYALMANALGELIDSDGKPVYKKANIYEWISNIQEMGNMQSFMNKEMEKE